MEARTQGRMGAVGGSLCDPVIFLDCMYWGGGGPDFALRPRSKTLEVAPGKHRCLHTSQLAPALPPPHEDGSGPL